MGDVILKMPVKSARRDRARPVSLYFDSGSYRTFVREDVAARLGHTLPLPGPEVFRGLGDGRFEARRMIRLLIRIKGIWCMHPAFVVPRRAMDEEILVGHDFMQGFHVRLDPQRRRILADIRDLKRGQRAY